MELYFSKVVTQRNVWSEEISSYIFVRSEPGFLTVIVSQPQEDITSAISKIEKPTFSKE